MNNLSPFKLGDCIELFIDHRGKTPAKMGGGWVEQGVRVISALNVHSGFIDNEESIRCVSYDIYKKWMTQDVKRDDCFIASEGASLGENTIWDSDEKIVLGQRLYALRTKKDVLDPWYFAAYMQTKKFRSQIDQISTGSTVFGISQPVLMNVVLLLPKIEEQRKIGKLYKSLKRKLENNLKIINELESMTKTLYDYWFLQFEFPNEEGKPYKSSGGKMVYNEELKRELPEGWEVKTIGDLVMRNNKKFDYKSVQKNIDLSVMPSDSIAVNQFNPSKDFSTNLFVMNKGDILFGSIRPYLHKACIAPCMGTFAGTVYSYSVKEGKDYNLVLTTLTRKAFFDYAESCCQGTKMPIVRNESILEYKLAYNSKFAKLFNDYVNIKDSVPNLIMQNQELASLRDFLLPMLMNGQVTFK